MARVIREEEMRAQEESERRAREIVTIAVQRIATEQVAELTTKTVEIPSDELEGPYHRTRWAEYPRLRAKSRCRHYRG